MAQSGSPITKTFTGGDLEEHFSEGKCPGRYNNSDFEKYRGLSGEEDGDNTYKDSELVGYY